jgi:hypothetical protein
VTQFDSTLMLAYGLKSGRKSAIVTAGRCPETPAQVSACSYFEYFGVAKYRRKVSRKSIQWYFLCKDRETVG